LMTPFSPRLLSLVIFFHFRHSAATFAAAAATSPAIILLPLRAYVRSGSRLQRARQRAMAQARKPATEYSEIRCYKTV